MMIASGLVFPSNSVFWDDTFPHSCAFLADSQSLIVAHSDGFSQFQVQMDGKIVKIVPLENPAAHFVDSHDFPLKHPSVKEVVTKILLSPDRQFLASVSVLRVQLWHRPNDQSHWESFPDITKQSRSFHTSCIAFSYDNQLFIVVTDKNLITYWQRTADNRWNMAYQHSLPPDTGLIISCTFSPDSRYLALGSTNGIIYILDRDKKWGCVNKLITSCEVSDCVFSPKEKLLLVTQGKDARLFRCTNDWSLPFNSVSTNTDLILPSPIKKSQNSLLKFCAFSADGQFFATVAQDQITLWHYPYENPARPIAVVAVFDQKQGASSVAFSPDGKWLAATGSHYPYTYIRVWNLAALTHPFKITHGSADV